MQRAALAVVRLLRFRWPHVRRVTVLCGHGNNGGDGLVIARLLQRQGLTVNVGLLGGSTALHGITRRAYDQFVHAGGTLRPPLSCLDSDVEVIVDALFGSGLSRPVCGEALSLIEAINASSAEVIAVDLPSGLCGTSGAVLGAAVRATATLTFIACKRGLLTAQGPDCCGTLWFDDLGIPTHVYATQVAATHCISHLGQLDALPMRARAVHKGQCGRVLLVGGNTGYSGAIQLAARACLRIGAGLVTLVCHPDSEAVGINTLEIIARRAADPESIVSDIDASDVIAIGPGLGVDDWAKRFLTAVLRAGKPIVADADALNLLGGFCSALPKNSVLTPHPAEAGRLLGVDTQIIQLDRFTAVARLAEQYSATVLLKGNGTLVNSGGKTVLIAAGNPSMASAGMGDVLSGMIAGLIGQGMPAERASIAAASLHAIAGDRADQRYARGLISSDIIETSARILAFL